MTHPHHPDRDQPPQVVVVDLGQIVGPLGDILDRLCRIEHRQHELKEYLVANFDALNDQIAGLGTALDEAIARIDADFQALKDQLNNDATDQAAVDAATAALGASVDRLRAIDPDPNNPAPPAEPTPGE